MGEAKRKAERLRAQFLADIEEWMFPASEWEARMVAEVRELPRVRAHRITPNQAADMGMPAKECHANCRWYQDNDPEGKARQITGWMHDDGGFVLHSVIERDGVVFCITPTPVHQEPAFEFIPDPAIEWRDEGDFRIPYRGGQKVGKGIREDPAAAMAQLEEIKRKLLSGMNPWEAIRRPD